MLTTGSWFVRERERTETQGAIHREEREPWPRARTRSSSSWSPRWCRGWVRPAAGEGGGWERREETGSMNKLMLLETPWCVCLMSAPSQCVNGCLQTIKARVWPPCYKLSSVPSCLPCIPLACPNTQSFCPCEIISQKEQLLWSTYTCKTVVLSIWLRMSVVFVSTRMTLWCASVQVWVKDSAGFWLIAGFEMFRWWGGFVCLVYV